MLRVPWITVVVRRDSVCAGDDCSAPHEAHFRFRREVSVRNALLTISRKRYLARIIGGKATWIACGVRPLGVVAEEWTEPKLWVSGDALLAEYLEDDRKLYFRYFAQESPEAVYEEGKRKKGEPGATDNPDDAQRLREDH